MKKIVLIAVAASSEWSMRLAESVAKLMSRELVVIDESCTSEEVMVRLNNSDCCLSLVYDRSFESDFASINASLNLINQGYEVIVVTNASPYDAGVCMLKDKMVTILDQVWERHYARFSEESKADYIQRAAEYLVWLIRESGGRTARINKEIERIQAEAEQRIAELQGMIPAET